MRAVGDSVPVQGGLPAATSSVSVNHGPADSVESMDAFEYVAPFHFGRSVAMESLTLCVCIGHPNDWISSPIHDDSPIDK